MISDENAKRLRELGVEIDPAQCHVNSHGVMRHGLSQLLDEVECLGQTWNLYSVMLRGKDGYYCDAFPRHTVLPPLMERWKLDLVADTPDNAVALALIAILEG